MSNYITTIEKYQGHLPKNKFYKFTRIVKGHNVIDVVRMTKKPECQITKIKAGIYLNKKTGKYRLFDNYAIYTKTGEVKKMPKKDGKQFRNRRSLRKIFTDLRRLIETNFQGGESNKFLTLTYREQHNDPKKILKDLDAFNHKLKRAYPKIAYIHIVEPHASGNFHVHSLLRQMDGSPIEMTPQDAFKLWGQGYVTAEDLNNTDNIGAYFIAYFSNMEIADEDLHKYKDDIKEIPRQDGNGTKKVIKGKRLDFYPDYMKIYRNSKNLTKPEVIEKVNDDYKKTYEAAYKITNTEENGNKSEVYIKKEQYKKRLILPT